MITAIVHVAAGYYLDGQDAMRCMQHIENRTYQLFAIIRNMEKAVEYLLAGRASLIAFTPGEYRSKSVEFCPTTNLSAAAKGHNSRWPESDRGFAERFLAGRGCREFDTAAQPQLRVVR